MRRLASLLPAAVSIAAAYVLWKRQLAYERALIRDLERFCEDVNGWLERSKREIERAFKKGAHV